MKSGYSITSPLERVIADQESGHFRRAKLAPEKGKHRTELGSIPDKKLAQGVAELRNEGEGLCYENAEEKFSGNVMSDAVKRLI